MNSINYTNSLRKMFDGKDTRLKDFQNTLVLSTLN